MLPLKYQNKILELVESDYYNCPQFCLIKLLNQLAIVAYKFPKIKLLEEDSHHQPRPKNRG